MNRQNTIEQSHVDSQQSLKESIHNELSAFRKEMDDFRKEFRTEINNLELRIKASHTNLLMKIFGIIVGCYSMAIAVAKLLW